MKWISLAFQYTISSKILAIHRMRHSKSSRRIHLQLLPAKVLQNSRGINSDNHHLVN